MASYFIPLAWLPIDNNRKIFESLPLFWSRMLTVSLPHASIFMVIGIIFGNLMRDMIIHIFLIAPID
jgi:hypothetical protein